MQIGILACASFLSATAVAATAGAQPAPPSIAPVDPRTMRGLFGPKPPAPADSQSLDLTVSLYGAFDGGTLGGAPVTAPARLDQNYGLAADATYARRGNVSASLQGSAAGFYYPGFDSRPVVSYGSTAAVGAKIGQAMAHVRGAVSLSPYSVLYPFPGAPAPTVGATAAPGTEYSASSQDVFRYTAGADLSHRLGRRASLSVAYEFRGTDIDAGGDRREQVAAVRVDRPFRRHLGVRLGYAFRESTLRLQDLSRTFHTHDIDVGINYNRALSFSRRTTFSFATGSMLLTQVTQVGTAPLGPSNRFLYLVGSAQLRREMGRTWSATIDYQRGAQFVEDFADPFLSDAVTAAVRGSPSRRVTFDASAAYGAGTVGRDTGDNGYDGYTGVVRVRTALTRLLAAEALYSYYRYSFESGVPLVVARRSMLERQTIRVGVALWLPIF